MVGQSNKLMQLLQKEQDEEKSTRQEAAEFVKKLLGSNSDNPLTYKQSLLLSATDLQTIVQDKMAY